MKNIFVFFIIILFPIYIYSQNDSNKTEVNNDKRWEHYYLEKIKDRIKENDIEELSSKLLSEDELEIRIWIFPAFSSIRGYIIRGNEKGFVCDLCKTYYLFSFTNR